MKCPLALLTVLLLAPLAPSLADAPPTPPLANQAAPDFTRIALKNPPMTDGTEKPEHWTQTWVGKGKIKSYRDTNTDHSAPASLALEAVDGAAQAQISQSFDVKGGERMKLSGWARADGGANAMLALQNFTADWRGIDFKIVGNAISGLDWQRASGEVTLPTNAARAAAVQLQRIRPRVEAFPLPALGKSPKAAWPRARKRSRTARPCRACWTWPSQRSRTWANRVHCARPSGIGAPSA